MPEETRNLEIVQAYFQAVAAGATGEALGRFLHPDLVQEEFPNPVVPRGARRDRAAVLAAAERGQAVISDQRYDVVAFLAQGCRVALEVEWSGTLKIPFGKLPAGHVMRARCGFFLELQGGLIVGQRNYDCYEPW